MPRTRRPGTARPRRAGQTTLVPTVKGHSNTAGGSARDIDGSFLPSPGSGATAYGYAFCSCGMRSPILPNGRERKLWHTRHREEIAGVPWK